MVKIGCLTFHGSHNYGSCLQAYALQTIFEEQNAEIDYKIINFRSSIQKKKYLSVFDENNKKNIYSRLFIPFQKRNLEIKKNLFEKFISNELNLTKELDENSYMYDVFKNLDKIIVGSDQIWNINAEDFSWIYFLKNCPKSIEKYSYAASIGSKENIYDFDKQEIIKSCLMDFDYISVRDSKSFEFTHKNVNENKQIRIDCDPTLLLTKENWEKLINSTNYKLPNEEYILFYDLSRNKENWKIAKQIAKSMNMKLIITSVPFPRVITQMISPKIIRKFDVGPKEWLKLINGAKLILSTSFHGTVFSILFEKQFFTINSENDNRISYLLNLCNLNHRNLTKCDVEKLKHNIDDASFEYAHIEINKMKSESLKYLNNIVKK